MSPLLLIDLAIGAIVVEWLAGRVWPRFGRATGALHLFAGLGLLLAWRAHAAGLAWPWVAGLLALAGLGHAADVVRRDRARRLT